MLTYLSCDWGTSSFRMKLIDAPHLQIRAEEQSDHGIAATYAAWKNTGQHDQDKRFAFYFKIIARHIKLMENRLNRSLAEVPVIVSGMASSSIGMKELPYSKLPFAISGADTHVLYMEPCKEITHPVLLISGASSGADVMRGEETQLIGFAERHADTHGDVVYIFPGTHSKHIMVNDGQITRFRTYMTGEFFELLSKKSILQASVADSQALPWPEERWQAFGKGVETGADTNLLHAAFLVRTNSLFGKMNKEDNLAYLSGLLIGAELKDLRDTHTGNLYLCSGTHLKAAYQYALQALNMQQTQIFSERDIEEAVMHGHLKIYQHHLTPKT